MGKKFFGLLNYTCFEYLWKFTLELTTNFACLWKIWGAEIYFFKRLKFGSM